MLKHTYTVYLGRGYGTPAETYHVYTCTYCGQDTRYPDGHTCTTLDLVNLPPHAQILRILDKGNDAPAGRAGMPQARHCSTPPYRASEEPYAGTPEEEELKKVAIELYGTPYPSVSKERDLIEAAMEYAATQAPYYDEGEDR